MKVHIPSWIPLIFLVLISTMLACSATVTLPQSIQQLSPVPPQQSATPTPPTIVQAVSSPTACPSGDCANVCLSKLDSIPQSSGSSDTRPKAAGRGPTGSRAITLVTYPVNGDQLGKPKLSDLVPLDLSAAQHDQQAQQRIWQYFTALIPADQRTELAYYIISSDGKGGMLASVEQFSGQSDAWALVVDPLDASKPRDLTFTLLHEFGHLLTLNSSQVQPDQEVLSHPQDLQVFEKEAASCPRYFASGGCSLSGSYINQFFDEYWSKIYGEWSSVNAAREDGNYLALLSRFYRNHATQFVTPYAATSPEEDMAETWAYFVLNRKPPDDSIAHKKVLFFYDFPQLVALRNEIISNMCVYVANQ